MPKQDHDVNNMGDFLQCKNPKCIWGATWSMGHICNHCHLTPCLCPCPLTKEWLIENRFEIGLKRVHELLKNDKAGIEMCRERGKESEAFKDTNKSKWVDNGKLELIERLYSYVTELKDIEIKHKKKKTMRDKVESKIKELDKIVKERSKSRSYQGWCAESIQLEMLLEMRDG